MCQHVTVKDVDSPHQHHQEHQPEPLLQEPLPPIVPNHPTAPVNPPPVCCNMTQNVHLAITIEEVEDVHSPHQPHQENQPEPPPIVQTHSTVPVNSPLTTHNNTQNMLQPPSPVTNEGLNLFLQQPAPLSHPCPTHACCYSSTLTIDQQGHLISL
jgi:hypothetical protein